ncbi:MAG: acyltransferase [Verrucomicrobiae bacterium]|nr:acyltransferase [Verrucomicrobiae bacterium]
MNPSEVLTRCLRYFYRASLRRKGACIANDLQFFDSFFSGEPKSLTIGISTYLEKGVKIVAYSQEPNHVAELKIGSHCFINHYAFIDCHHQITIEDRCLIGPYAYICDFDHVTVTEQERFSTAPVCIQSDVWIGAHACILKGVTVGHHSIIAAGAVVTDSIPPFSIAAGVPARVVKKIQSND